MPFTIAHAAAALPVRRTWRALPLDALVLGAMSPDFEYVLRLAVRGGDWHTAAGLVLACAPATLVAVWLWRALVRPALVPLLPAGMRPASPNPGRSASYAVALAVLAALLGALTHVLWDGFTHETGWAVARMPALLAPASALGLPVPWYNVLQHASTLFGGTVLLFAIGGWARRHPPDARRFAPGQLRAAVRATAFIVIGAVLAAVANGSRGLGAGVAVILGYAAVGGMAGLALAATAYGLAARIRR